jgi:hypothetical protein
MTDISLTVVAKLQKHGNYESHPAVRPVRQVQPQCIVASKSIIVTITKRYMWHAVYKPFGDRSSVCGSKHGISSMEAQISMVTEAWGHTLSESLPITVFIICSINKTIFGDEKLLYFTKHHRNKFHKFYA